MHELGVDGRFQCTEGECGTIPRETAVQSEISPVIHCCSAGCAIWGVHRRKNSDLSSPRYCSPKQHDFLKKKMKTLFFSQNSRKSQRWPMVDWLIDWMNEWTDLNQWYGALIYWLVDWVINKWIDWLIDWWFIDELFDIPSASKWWHDGEPSNIVSLIWFPPNCSKFVKCSWTVEKTPPTPVKSARERSALPRRWRRKFSGFMADDGPSRADRCGLSDWSTR